MLLSGLAPEREKGTDAFLVLGLRTEKVAYEKLPEILQQIVDAVRTEIGDANISPT